LGFTSWAARWFPDAYIFAALAVILVSAAALANGATPQAVAKSFGDGFWTLITFTMQMAFVVIGGYVVAMSPPAARLIRGLASLPGSGPRAVAFVAAISMLSSLLNWGSSLIFSGLLVRELARRSDLGIDYRAAGAAGYETLGDKHLRAPELFVSHDGFASALATAGHRCIEAIPDEILAHVAPLGWEHIAFNGDYVWPAQPLGNAFRPLRNPRAEFLDAA